MRWKHSREAGSDKLLGSDGVENQKIKVVVKEILDVHCKTGLGTLKLYLLEGVEKDLNWVASLEMLKALRWND